MSIYRIETAQPARRAAIQAWLHGLDLISAPTRQKIVTAWTSAWLSSTHEQLEDMPYSLNAPKFPLMQHVNEVTRTGLDLARRATAEWDYRPDPEILLPILILHDIDKPLLYQRRDGIVVETPLYRCLPHGVPGALMLHELGSADLIVSTVATHAANAPFHGSTMEAYLLH